MLSILIPIYNFNVVDFIKDLKNQADSCGIEYEILCLDDFSNDDIKKENEELGNMEYVFYEELPKNIGRSKIRNKLAQKSQFPYLLFLDCDSKTVDKQFVKRYINSIDPDKITYGGRCYESQAPKSTSEYFRWWYGMNRETISVAQRKKQPYHSFMTNNFLIPKTIFNAIKLDEQLIGYGHEDTLFGLELKKQGIEIRHINNPLCHIGLENFEVFIAKTEEGIRNLKKLIDENKMDDSVKLFRYYKLLKKIGVEKKVLNYYQKNKAFILQKLQENEPNLRWFDLYKLGYLISLNR